MNITFEQYCLLEDSKEQYKKWKELVNMTYGELEEFLNSDEGEEAGLSRKEASNAGSDGNRISTGRDSARAILRMMKKPYSEWNETDIEWMKKQISFISRMSASQGELLDEEGNKTRKYLSLLIWGHDPLKNKVNETNLSSLSKFCAMNGLLFEVVSTTPYERVSHGHYEAKVANDLVEVSFDGSECGLYGVAFSVNGKYALAKNPNFQKIMSVVINIIMDFSQQDSVNGIYFRAKNEGSRPKNYMFITYFLVSSEKLRHQYPEIEGWKKEHSNGDVDYGVLFYESARKCLENILDLSKI